MNSCLNVVYFFEPWIELGRPYLRYHNLRYQLGPQISALSKLGCKVTVIMGESTHEKTIQDNYYIDNVEFKSIREDELREIFPNYLECSNSLHKNIQSSEQESEYTKLIEDKLGFNNPDVFISFLSPVDFLKNKWKNTLFLYAEFGMFSRVPYPRTFYFDCFGMFEKSYVRQIENENFNHSKNDIESFNAFKNSIDLNEGENFAQPSLTKFNKNILIPLQFSNYFGFDATSKYKSQYEFLIDTLNNIPEDIGAIVTEHTGWEKTINEHNYEYLIKKYPNLILSEKLFTISNSSQTLIRQVDAVASVSSSVALQGAFWGKPIFAMGDSHLNTFNAGNIKDASMIIESHNPQKNNDKIIHLLKNYYITEKYAYNGTWFHNKLLELIDAKEKGKNPYQHEVDKNYLTHLKNNTRNREYRMTLNQNKNEIDNTEKSMFSDFEIISFDIFDTLIQRPLNMPHQMFLFMQEDARKITGDKHFEFHKIRRACEHKVRKNTNKIEVTIEDIYEQIKLEYQLSETQKDKLIELEIQTELYFCEERVSGKELFNLAKRQGKRILLISDFHIHQKDVESLLKKCGYDGWDKLYVSCDVNKTKKNGSLFEHVIIENGINPSSMLHIGDNYESDIENAQSFKIKTLHTPKGTDLFFRNHLTNKVWEQEKNRVLYPTDSLAKASAAVVGLSINKLHSNLDNSDRNSLFGGDANKLGYCLFGPLFTSFALELAKNGNDKNYNFLSRDGSIFMKVFKELFPEYNSNYIYTSRRALSLPTLTDEDSLLQSLSIPFSPAPLRKLLENKYGIKEEEMKNIIFPEDEDINLETRVHPAHSMIALKKLFKINQELLMKNAKIELEAAEKYLNETFNEDSIIVDIGYSGSLQSYIEKITNLKLHGFYLMTHLKGKAFKENNLSMKGFLGDYIDHTATTSPYKDRISFLEFICSNDESSLLRYTLNDDGSAGFIFKDENLNTSRRRIVSREIQSGILEFVRDYKKYFSKFNQEIDLDKNLITQWLFDFLSNPAPIDAKIFNNIDHEDAYSNHDKRYIISDIERTLTKHNRKLTAEQARKLVEISDWKEGARAILPAKKGTKKIAPETSNFVKLVVTPQNKIDPIRKVNNAQNIQTPNWSNKTKTTNKTKAKFNKLMRDPKRFFTDAIRKYSH